ncbi:MAG: restriction endonuclease, partial [Parabacteroides sp.]|nr:restriction endonuclease [Parabacteroides sp.]
PIYGEPNSVCSYTYICIGYAQHYTKVECMNIISYIETKFFRYLVSIKKKTQDASREVYQFVPLLDFSHPWTDEMLYEKYGLDEKEIAFIESMIRPME